MNKVFYFVLFILFSVVLSAQNEARLLRFPTIYKNQIVFSYSGDLYTVGKKGGTARRLTNDVGYDMFARFSPDGKWIAFTGQYDGNTEVYVMPSQGGTPKRLTYTATLGRDDISDRMGPNNIVMTWKDNENIVFRSRMKSFNDFKGQLFTININGGMPEELPLPCGGFCSYSSDKSKLAYNRVFREFRTWKYYKGGMADDIWIYDFYTKQTENITNNKYQDIMPMWHGSNIYFLSDRDRTMNLFCYNLTDKQTKKLTDFTEYDIKFASFGDSAITFENGGFIYYYCLAKQEIKKVNIIISDDMTSSRKALVDCSKFIESVSISSDGKRVCVDARGQLFTLPAKTGITRQITYAAGVHNREAVWSPDGKSIAYISDISGEDEIYIINQDGTGTANQLTTKSDTYKYSLSWSPDNKKILWSDKMQRLQYVEIETKKVILVDKSKDWEFTQYNWSPDSKWITYVRPDKISKSKIYLFDVINAKSQPITDGWYDCNDPVFSPDGKYLYLTSNRDFDPIYSSVEWNTAYQYMTKVYMITLNKNIKSPFEPENDEVNAPPVKEPDNKDLVIDFDGIQSRIIQLPVEQGMYWSLYPVDGGIYYMKITASNTKPQICWFELKEKKETQIGDFSDFELSSDNKKMLVVDNNKYSVVDLPKSKLELKDFIDLNNMKIWVDKKAEWNQIYTESWRQMRDFFYAPNMHGVDWKAIKKKYEPLVAYVNNRNDLNYIIGEMIGELSIGHAYVGGGDKPAPPRYKTGLLGAVLSKDKSGAYRIDKILKGENWTKNTRSPLTEVGVNVKEGDYIIAVNGKPTSSMVNIYESLINTSGTQVELTISSTPDGLNSHKAIVIPIDDESNLYYYNWVQANIKKVNDATDGKVGYVHIPDMSAEGLNEFVKYFYPQLSKKALIVDDRGNGGGNVSPMIIERLNRQLVVMEQPRNGSPTVRPEEMIIGPKVCLVDCYSASDGDLFPYQFRALKIGKLIGMRTWGGVVGIRGSLPFVDGGLMTKPEFAHYDADGKTWIIEGHGVDPDIVIDNDPAKEYAGEDQQLNKAIEVILQELKNYKQELPPAPAFPDKSN